jgi:hypothetical protein
MTEAERVAERIALYFGNDDRRIYEIAKHLSGVGLDEEAIRATMGTVFSAGYDEGVRDGG